MLGSEEHTILLSRKRLNQEMKKKMFIIVPVGILY